MCQQKRKESKYMKKGNPTHTEKMLKEKTKNVNRNLGTKNINAWLPISMAEVERYWKSL
jgi:hypothetical protein